MALLFASSCLDVPALSDGPLRVSVYGGGSPVDGALVRVWLLDEDGTLAGPDGTGDLSGRDIEAMQPMARGRTDGDGQVELSVGTGRGTLMVVATSGSTLDLGLGARTSIPEDVALRAVLVDYAPYTDEHVEVTVSPLTTLAVTMGEARVARGDRTWRYAGAMRHAHDLLRKHFDGVDIIRTRPVSRVDAGDDLNGGETHFLVLAALSHLARGIADSSGVEPRSFDSFDLLQALMADASDPQGLFDGIGPIGPIRVGACARPQDCEPGSLDGDCRTFCDIGSSTLRADLANALSFGFLPSEANQGNLDFDDVRLLVATLAGDGEPELFGLDSGGTVTGPLPVIDVEVTTLVDESKDIIHFTDSGIPVHQPSSSPLDDDDIIELGAAGDCPTVHKYVHRLDDPEDNPLRWSFDVHDRSGAGIDDAQYRLRVRTTPESSESTWTEWLDATPVSSRGDGTIRYEARILRQDMPELATESGIFEIEFRGRDRIGILSDPVSRCWDHVPLSPPLQLIGCREATGPSSLHGVNLYPGNNLAPYLNGVPLAQGLALMECELRNGTRESVYMSLQLEQSMATYVKSWQKTNVLLETISDTQCLMNGECLLDFPPDQRTTVSSGETGVIDALANGFLLWDMNTGKRIDPCPTCESNQYRIEPRVASSTPHEYLLQVVVADLRALAPEPLGEDWGPFVDVPIDPTLMPIPITGRSFGRVRLCEEFSNEESCVLDNAFAHYLALTDVSLRLNWLGIRGWLSPMPHLPSLAPASGVDVFGIPVHIEYYEWSSSEQVLSPPNP